MFKVSIMRQGLQDQCGIVGQGPLHCHLSLSFEHFWECVRCHWCHAAHGMLPMSSNSLNIFCSGKISSPVPVLVHLSKRAVASSLPWREAWSNHWRAWAAFSSLSTPASARDRKCAPSLVWCSSEPLSASWIHAAIVSAACERHNFNSSLAYFYAAHKVTPSRLVKFSTLMIMWWQFSLHTGCQCFLPIL